MAVIVKVAEGNVIGVVGLRHPQVRVDGDGESVRSAVHVSDVNPLAVNVPGVDVSAVDGDALRAVDTMILALDTRSALHVLQTETGLKTSGRKKKSRKHYSFIAVKSDMPSISFVRV